MQEIETWWWFEKHLVPPQEYNPYPKDNPINYKVNSYNYRCPEFDTIEWEKSYVVFGGSDIFGEGVPDDQIFTVHLEKLLKQPVVNMGISAASNQQIVLAISMLARYHKPKAWIIAWSDAYRWLHWNPNETDAIRVQAPRGPHKEFCSEPFPQLLESLPWYSSQARVTALSLCQDRLIETGVSTISTLKEWGVPGFNIVDDGRIVGHSGPETHKKFAEWVYLEIKRRRLS
jgi:hypothetical protein